MRVVAGQARGRRLAAPRGLDTRPTSDRVREAMFNALRSIDALAGARVVDLFAGSGAMGIEALSRGAASCVFVERDPAAVAVIQQNLAHTGVSGGSVVRADVMRWLAAHGRPATPWDLVLADPPYAFDEWSALLDGLDAEVVVVESDREVDPGNRWLITRSKRYGGTVVTFVARAAQR
jgi:16S rRNA (guanine966-N2)-methyltransferase